MFFKRIGNTAPVLMFLFASVVLFGHAEAAVISLGFDSAPSSQGWEFKKTDTGSHAGDSEAGVFSVSTDRLTMNTMSAGFVSPSAVGYTNTGVVKATLPWTLEWTLRIVDYEKVASGPDFGSWFAVYNDVSVVGVAISDVGLTVYDGIGGTSILRDNTSFQDFRLEYTPDAGVGAFDLFIDNALITSGAGRSISGDRFFSDNQLFLGDGTGAANAHWEMTSYVFTQNQAAGAARATPEPSSLAMWAGLGVMGLFAARRWRRK